MERCPNCRARYKGEPVCYRCGCDLSLLLRIEANARRLERLAILRLAKGDTKGAERAAERAVELQRCPFTLALQAFIRHQLAEQASHVPFADELSDFIPHP